MAINIVASDHLKKSIQEVSDQPKHMWSILNSALGRTSSPVLSANHDISSLVNEFNTAFLDKPAKLRLALMQSSNGCEGKIWTTFNSI